MEKAEEDIPGAVGDAAAARGPGAGELAEQLEAERRIAELVRGFLSTDADSFEVCMQRGLGDAGALAAADRAEMFLAGRSARAAGHHYQWVAPGVPPSVPVVREESQASFRWGMEQVLAGRIIHVARLSDLPEEAASERDRLAADGVRSYLAVPIQREGSPVGVLAFSRLTREGGWSPAEIVRMKLVAEVVGSAVRRLRAEDERREAQERLHGLMNGLAQQLEVEKRLAAFSRSLLETTAETLDTGIRRGLELAAGLAAVDRVILVSNLGDARNQAAVYQWHAPELPPRAPRLSDLEGPVARRLFRGELVCLPDASAIRGSAGREEVLAAGVRSQLYVPILDGERLSGVLCFEAIQAERSWSEADLTLLRMVADHFDGALRRKRSELMLRESQQQLVHAQKMEAVGTLAGGIAHDFNNQLTVMLANARYALRESGAEGELRQALEDLHRSAEHCAQLTRSLLAFSRRRALTPRAIRVDQVLGEALELLRPLLPSSIVFEVESHAGGAGVIVDPTQLHQVLVNLVVNARDAMPGGGCLSLRVGAIALGPRAARRLGLASAGPYVEFTVADTGCGMDESLRARIFEPFFTTKPVGQGTGLGLATVYGIVEESRGTLTVESTPGEGSTFRVLLPQSVSLGEGVSEEAADRSSPGGAGTVLVAEDEPGVRRLLERILREAGYQVIAARDGAEALSQARDHAGPIDVLVTDLEMPRMTGRELATLLERERPGLPVLFVSGTVANPIQGESDAALLPRARFVPKPFGEHALLAGLSDLLKETD